jgi:hypothetical protein
MHHGDGFEEVGCSDGIVLAYGDTYWENGNMLVLLLCNDDMNTTVW